MGMVTARVKGHQEVTAKRATKNIAQSCGTITSDFYRAILYLSLVSRIQNEECAHRYGSQRSMSGVLNDSSPHIASNLSIEPLL